MKNDIKKDIKKVLQSITKIELFINKYNWEQIKFPSEKGDWKKIQKNNVTTALKFCMLKKKKYILLVLQNITQIVISKLSF